MKNSKNMDSSILTIPVGGSDGGSYPIKCKTKIDGNLKISNINDVLKLPQVVSVRGDFSEEMANEFATSFHNAENGDQEVIPVVIDSFGGDVYALLSMIDIMASSKKKIATIVMGKAMSAGAVLVTCGSKGLRFASPHSTIMIHSASGGGFGNVDEMKINVKELVRLNKKILEIMSTNCGHSKGHFEKILNGKKTDWFMNPSEAKKHNLINEIRIPEFSIEISSRIEFK
jgi:ATP-dependent Clp protease protease subunit